MIANLLWTGREYYSLENCIVDSKGNGVDINSVIVGYYKDVIYRVNYNVKATASWETTSLEIIGQFNNVRRQYIIKSDGKGNWFVNGKSEQKFAGCIDVDIPLTPFTNTLPINRLKLGINEQQIIKVVYCDLLQNEFYEVRQKYKRLSESIYHYQNVPNDFEADVEVDENGFVIDYPQLFIRTAINTSSAPSVTI